MDVRFAQRKLKPRPRLVAVLAPGDHLCEQRIVVRRHGQSGLGPAVHADAGAGWKRRHGELSARRPEAIVRVLSDHARFNRVAVLQRINRRVAMRAQHVRQTRGESRAGRDRQLFFDQIQSCAHFSDRVFDLQPRVDFDEIKLARPGRHEKFHGARAAVMQRRRQARRHLAHAPGVGGRQRRGRRFFDQFLMPALHRTFALAQRNRAAMAIAQNLNFNVSRALDVLLDEHARIVKRGARLG